MISGPRIRVLGPVLAIEAVTSEDAGTYKCLVSNTGGEASAELRLTITAPLQVDVVPNVMSVHMGASAEFRCTVTSNGMTIGLQHITWYKDGRQLPSSSRSGDTLLIADVGREDKGMYQCVVRRQDGDSFQASAELQLGGKFTLFLSHTKQKRNKRKKKNRRMMGNGDGALLSTICHPVRCCERMNDCTEYLMQA